MRITDNMTQREIEVCIILLIALSGEITPNMRTIQFEFTDNSITFYIYYDGEISEKDEEYASCIETEVMALCPADHFISYELIRWDLPKRRPQQGRESIYARNEQELCDQITDE